MPLAPYSLDPSDPPAPTAEQWAAMSQADRDDVIASLPSEPPCDAIAMPEGDGHRLPKENAARPLAELFQRTGRRVYLLSQLPAYYPGEPHSLPADLRWGLTQQTSHNVRRDRQKT